jgi:hypothetical protein
VEAFQGMVSTFFPLRCSNLVGTFIHQSSPLCNIFFCHPPKFSSIKYEGDCRGLLTRTVRIPICFAASMFLKLSSNNIWKVFVFQQARKISYRYTIALLTYTEGSHQMSSLTMMSR